jgi:oligoendopeptidase F
VSNERECQRKFEEAHHDLAQSTEETYVLKTSKEETEKYLEDYRALKRDIAMVSGFVSILLHDKIPDTVHYWKLAGIRESTVRQT